MSNSEASAVVLRPGSLSLREFRAVAEAGAPVEVDGSAWEGVRRSREVVERIVAEGRTVYGINTGFGALKNRAIPGESLEILQENLVVSHAVGLGPPLRTPLLRGMMLLRLASLSRGFSGIREETLRLLEAMLNRGVHPVVPEDGSVGASGDLAPLAHVALAMIGRGRAESGGEVLDARAALARAGLAPVRLQAKEGLALTNGTPLMTAYAAFLALGLETLLRTADLAAALSIEAGVGTRAACDPRIHRLRPHPGQARSAAHVWGLLEDSAILRAHRDCSKVQDQYSFRCTPQVHGAAWQGLIEKLPSVLTEMNAVTDNPLVFPDGAVLSGGNFHGGTVARVLSEFGPTIASVGAISEKRTSWLLDPRVENGLPGFLVEDPSSSGFMIPQYVAASYVAENGKLCTPVANLTGTSTSAGQEDHVSLGPAEGKFATRILENTRRVLAIEFLCAAQALDLQERRLGAAPAKATAAVRALMRAEGVPFVERDGELKPLLDRVCGLVDSGRLVEAAEGTGFRFEGD
ncbi:MAG: histidine ammonia-lyase [Planctomycetes bacterium]|nr:histidine ammonia-lyase [Planctomycetota bacterium]